MDRLFLIGPIAFDLTAMIAACIVGDPEFPLRHSVGLSRAGVLLRHRQRVSLSLSRVIAVPFG